MANLTANDYNGFERATLSDQTYVRRTNETGLRLLTIYTIVATAVLAVLTYAAVLAFQGWAHAIVIGVGLVTFYGLSLWVWPERKRIY